MDEGASIGGAGQQANVQGIGHTIVQIIGDEAQVILNGAVGLRLETYRRQAEPTVSPEKAGGPGYTQTGLRETLVLSPYNRISLDFRGRDAELNDLWAWMTAQEARSAHIVIGTGGRGKTRLAVELAAKARAAGWNAGFVPSGALKHFEAHGCRWHWDQPTLLIIDYAAAQYKPLATALRALVTTEKPPTAPPLRILLLERYGDQNSTWWRELFGGGDALAEEVGDLLHAAAPLRLEPLGAEARFAVFAQAFQAATPTPAPARSPTWDETLARLSLGGDPLFLAMAGLVLARQGVGVLADLTSDKLAFKLAKQELQRVEKHWRAAGLPLVDEASLPAHLTAFATLCGGLSAESAHRVIAEESAALYQAIPEKTTATAFAALRSALPDATGGIARIEPDILGEAIVIQAFDRLQDGGLAALKRAATTAQTSVFQTIIRTCQDFLIRGEKRPLRWLQALKAAAADFGTLIELSDAMPHETLELREIAAEMAEAIVGYCRALPMPDSAPLLASALNNLSNRLSALGQRENALAAVQEAVDLYRALAAARSNAFTADLASALHNLSNRLSDLGQRENALAAGQEAVALRRTLAAVDPDAFTPGLALALNNLSARLSALGQREDALAAVQEAVDLYRSLAAARPDAFTADLASALNNLSIDLSALGQRETGLAAVQEAVDLYRALAAARPDAFTADLASALNNLSISLSNLGRRETALAAVQETVTLYRALAVARPNAFTADLAGTLGLTTHILAALGRDTEAVTLAHEAIGLLAPYFDKHQLAFAGLMEALVRDYLTPCDRLNLPPDDALLVPILARLQSLTPEPPHDA
jgi:tetratricopeptide (TPR) repeat protein